MKNKSMQEMLVSGVLIVLLILFVNPFNFWMPTMMLAWMILGLVVCFAIFATFIWRERPADEREGAHKMIAGRIAFLVGTTLLVVGIIYQSFNHILDTWLVVTLVGMIIAKICGLAYVQKKY